MPPYKVEGARQAPGAHAIVSGQLDLRFQPELRLSIHMVDVDMRSQLLTREEVKAISTMAKDCWAHLAMLHRAAIGRDNGVAPAKLRRAYTTVHPPPTSRAQSASAGCSTEPLTQAASSGASSSRVTRDNPSFVSTRFSAATDTLLGAVISMPIG
jgi:hypothetical protein